MNDNTVNAVMNEETVKACPDCGSEDIDIIDEERVCKHCGLVIE